MLVRVPVSAGIFLYVTKRVQRRLAVAFGNKLFGSRPNIGRHISLRNEKGRSSSGLRKETMLVRVRVSAGIFLYVTIRVERRLAVAFGNKLCWFESQYRPAYFFT